MVYRFLMPRPLRIEYENAYYHVMNRGAGRKPLFYNKRYYEAFLGCLAEAHVRFGLTVHAYCLMGNHYHLLLQTPNANLGRVMRHINGVYTQRHNRLRHTDGPLFRGRYKAILVEADAYLLQLSRYIHRNPVELKAPLVKQLEAYPWSSYPAYINTNASPDWLHRETIYGLLGRRQRYAGYHAFVELGVDEETQALYHRGNYPAVICGDGFRAWLYEQKLPDLDTEKRIARLSRDLSLKAVTTNVAKAYGEPEQQLRAVKRGSRQGLESRKVAMYLCQRVAGATLDEIAGYFGLSHRGGVSFVLHQIRQARAENRGLDRRIEQIAKNLLKQDT